MFCRLVQGRYAAGLEAHLIHKGVWAGGFAQRVPAVSGL